MEIHDDPGFALPSAAGAAALAPGGPDHRRARLGRAGDGEVTEHGSNEAGGAEEPYDRRLTDSGPDARPSRLAHPNRTPSAGFGGQSAARSDRLGVASAPVCRRAGPGLQRLDARASVPSAMDRVWRRQPARRFLGLFVQDGALPVL